MAANRSTMPAVHSFFSVGSKLCIHFTKSGNTIGLCNAPQALLINPSLLIFPSPPVPPSNLANGDIAPILRNSRPKLLHMGPSRKRLFPRLSRVQVQGFSTIIDTRCLGSYETLLVPKLLLPTPNAEEPRVMSPHSIELAKCSTRSVISARCSSMYIAKTYTQREEACAMQFRLPSAWLEIILKTFSSALKTTTHKFTVHCTTNSTTLPLSHSILQAISSSES